jgi:hypothetical protein
MTPDVVEAVLEKFRPHFKGDGSDLLLVQIPIYAETCVECLLPQDMIAKVLDNAIRAVAPDLLRVDVRIVKSD